VGTDGTKPRENARRRPVPPHVPLTGLKSDQVICKPERSRTIRGSRSSPEKVLSVIAFCLRQLRFTLLVFKVVPVKSDSCPQPGQECNLSYILDGLTSIGVLMAEDFALFCRSVCSILATRPDLQAVCAVPDGLDAVLKAEVLKPDLFLLDIGLPTLNGIEAARQICARAPTVQNNLRKPRVCSPGSTRGIQFGGVSEISPLRSKPPSKV
jgi:CheY-like chemotaxis protein